MSRQKVWLGVGRQTPIKGPKSLMTETSVACSSEEEHSCLVQALAKERFFCKVIGIVVLKQHWGRPSIFPFGTTGYWRMIFWQNLHCPEIKFLKECYVSTRGKEARTVFQACLLHIWPKYCGILVVGRWIVLAKWNASTRDWVYRQSLQQQGPSTLAGKILFSH